MLISISLSGKLLSTWHFPEKVNNKPFTLSGFAVISRFSRKTRAFLWLQNSICFIMWLIGILESGCFMFYAKYLFLWTLLCRCVNRLHHNQRAFLVQIVIIIKKVGVGINALLAPFPPCAFRSAPCVARCSPQRGRSGPFCMRAAASWLIWKMTVRLWMTTVPHWFVMKPLSRLTNEGEGNVQAYD